MRVPFTTVLERRVREAASTVPGQWSASDPHVPSFRSVAPVSLTTIVYGMSDISMALSPTANHASEGPLSVIVAFPLEPLVLMSPGIKPAHPSMLPHEVSATHWHTDIEPSEQSTLHTAHKSLFPQKASHAPRALFASAAPAAFITNRPMTFK